LQKHEKYPENLKEILAENEAEIKELLKSSGKITRSS